MGVTVYISQTDVDEFRTSGQTLAEGYAYEWEGEGVVHLHLHPLHHAFGKVSRCLFACEERIFDGWQIVVNEETRVVNRDAELHFIPAKKELYSRSKGILEVNVLEKKHVAIVGLGSFGSHIAIELAKAGVGEFSLLDFDRVELHNLARHTCTAQELGRTIMKISV